MAENVVDIKIKAKVDTRELQKEMRQIAETSKTSIEQSYKNLEVTMRKSVEALGGDLEKVGRNVSFDAFLDSFRSQMQQLNEEIRQTGNLPLGMTSKIFDAEQAVDGLIDRYYKLYESISKFTNEEKYVDTSKYTELASEVSNVQGKFEATQGTMNRLAQEFADLEEREQLVAKVGGQQVVDKYNERLEKIKELEDEVRRLKQLQGADITQGRYTGLFGNELEENRQQIDALEQQIERLQAATRFFGNDTIATLERIRDLEARISEENLKPGGREKIIAEMDAEEAKLVELGQKYDEVKAKLKELEQSGEHKQLSQAFIEATREAEKLEVEIVKASAHLNELQEKAQKTSISMSKLRNAAWAFSRVLGNVYTLGLDVVRGAKMIANFYTRIWNAAKKVLSVFKQLKDKVVGTAKEHAKSWKTMLRDVLRYSLGIRSLFALFRRLRKYIKEAFEAMGEQIPEVNQMLNELRASLGMLKGSLATAFEPILSAITPALNILIEKLAQALTYIGMFFAALTGRGYVYKAKKAIQGITDAAKDMNKQLQGFDELNNLTTQKDGGGGSPLAEFEKVDVPDWIKNLADKIKDIFNQIIEPIKRAWEKVGDYVIEAWKHAAYSLRDLLADVGRDFLRAWAERAEQIFINIFNIVGDIGNAVGYIADALREAWNYNENGYKILKAILDIVERITYWISEITLDFAQWTRDLDVTPAMTAFREWLESLVPVADTVGGILYDFWNDTVKPILTWTFDGENSGIARLFRIFRDFNKKVNWQKLRTNLDKVWVALGKFGEKIGEGLLDFLNDLADRLADWINSDDFDATIDKIVKFLDDFDAKDLKDDLDQVLRILKNIADKMWKIIKYVIDHKDEILDFLEWVSEHLELIAGTAVFGKLAIDFSRFLLNAFMLKSVIVDLTGAEGFKGLAAAILNCEPTFASIAGTIGGLVIDAGLLVGAILILKATFDTFFDPKVVETFKTTFSDMATLVEDFFTGNWVDLSGDWEQIKLDWAELTYNLKESFYNNVVVPFAEFFHQEIPSSFAEFRELRNQVEGTQNALRYMYEDIDSGALPSLRNIKEAVKENVTDSSEWEGEIQKLKDKILEVNPELDALSQAMKENNINGADNIDTLEQIYIGLDKFKQNGGDAKDTCKYLKDEFGKTDSAAKDFFVQLAKGKDSAKDVADSLGKLADSTQQAWNKMPTSKDTEKLGADSVKGYGEGITKNEDVYVKNPIQKLATNIVNWFHDSALKFGSPSVTMRNFGKDTIVGFNNGITAMQSSSMSVIRSYINSVVNAFTGMRNSIMSIFSNLASSIGSVMNSIASGVSSVMSNIANTIGNLKSNINNITSGISSKFNVHIPRLAQGAVIPPNNEFLAVLGDQKKGTNIESPLSTMVEAFNMANKGGNEQELALLQEQNDLLRQLLNKEFGISGDDIFRSVRNSARTYKKSTGNSAFA